MSLILPFGGRTYAPAGGLTSLADLFTGQEGFCFEVDNTNCYTDNGRTTLATNGQDVAGVTDASGNGNHSNTPLLNNGPVFTGTSAPYSLETTPSNDGTVLFNGLSDPSQTGWGVLWFGRFSAFTATTLPLRSEAVIGGILMDTTSGNKACVQLWDGSGAITVGTGATTLSTGVDYVLIANLETSGGEIFVDGVSDGTCANAAGTLSTSSANFAVGGRTNALLNHINGFTKAAAVRVGPFTSGEIADIQAYLNP